MALRAYRPPSLLQQLIVVKTEEKASTVAVLEDVEKMEKRQRTVAFQGRSCCSAAQVSLSNINIVKSDGVEWRSHSLEQPNLDE